MVFVEAMGVGRGMGANARVYRRALFGARHFSRHRRNTGGASCGGIAGRVACAHIGGRCAANEINGKSKIINGRFCHFIHENALCRQ